VVDLHGLDDRVVTLADAFRVEQVVLNLLTNADKYTPADLPIDVTVTRQERTAVVSVRDRGEGIPLEHQGRIFDRFFRVNEGGGRPPGTGLGLYIARALVEAMSGRIWVESQVGVGSIFSFTLPIVNIRIPDRGDPRHARTATHRLMAV
jgi:histidine kinase